ncbi:CPBP family intramembrane metalloprotease [Paenibacillus thiaminolyticus]|uniref:CPBP family intramembrane glutamic endopeptidase n=1 Tax=Paenibacillus thiaminolyticus TaxID=49283 RepID=UPI00232C721E|nr:CPBP family intramembrane glutamic endopeptidase [Paenibacillus thiaminolyticus]WCF09599.1 CPBP family intramembrane metalloprotease [Paenibacillus thiaminolyticus]
MPVFHHVTKRLWLASIIGFIVFVLLQIVIPSLQEANRTGPELERTLLTKRQAAERAVEFAKREPGRSRIMLSEQEPTVVYQTDRLMSGYMNRERLTASYAPWDSQAPIDIYQVLLGVTTPDGNDILKVDVHMTSGSVVGYELAAIPGSPQSEAPALAVEKARAIADRELNALGWDVSKLELQSVDPSRPDELRYTVKQGEIGAAGLELVVRMRSDRVVALHPVWSIPSDYKDIDVKQTETAGSLYRIGYRWMSMGLSMLALWACIYYRRRIRFGSGTLIALSLLSCAISMLHMWNMMPGLVVLQFGVPRTELNLNAALVLQGAITVTQGLFLYFSLVSGSYFWRQSGRSELLPTWRDRSFGTVLTGSFRLGTLYAGVLLGVQSVIFLTLETGFGAWSATDASMSPLNLTAPALYPLLAWMAAISEEGVFRWFGTGLLNRWIRNPWAAGVIPTLIWAFGHVTYPIYPYYSRPVELLIIGLLFLAIMLRHGFWTAMFAHLMLDNVLMSISYLLEGTASGLGLGVFYLALPMLIVYSVRYLHRYSARLP